MLVLYSTGTLLLVRLSFALPLFLLLALMLLLVLLLIVLHVLLLVVWEVRLSVLLRMQGGGLGEGCGFGWDGRGIDGVVVVVLFLLLGLHGIGRIAAATQRQLGKRFRLPPGWCTGGLCLRLMSG